jgi:spore coat protein U-like protein
MNMKRLTIFASALLVLGVFAAGPALAVTAQDNLTVTATVAETCTVGVTTHVAFDAYDAMLTAVGTNKDATGVITVNCVKGSTIVSIDLNQGLHESAGNLRQMGGGSASHIEYHLYKPISGVPAIGCAYTDEWKTGTTDGLVPNPSTIPSNVDYTHNICGRVALGQDVEVAVDYSDTVVVTVNY